MQDINLLTQLTAAANNTVIPDLSWPFTPGDAALEGTELNGLNDRRTSESERHAADHFDAFLRAVDLADGNPARSLFARRVAELVDALGQAEVADDLMRRFDTPAEAEDSGESTGTGYPAENGRPEGNLYQPGSPSAGYQQQMDAEHSEGAEDGD